ncbi:MAG: 2-oxoacid:acceptor oxidoreductase family protein [Rhodospirillales bacterium]|nr:2-oxoacid:acceptor oxidoreductase family protein [Rhodospirillales bacterium]
MDARADTTPPTNVLIVGVGGQGVIMVSKVLAQLCQRHGLQVKQSEVHGMAKRGGGVFSHVRFGPQVWSPVIPKGEVDILVALEWAEGLRWLNHLRRDGGTFVADTQQIVPPISFRNRSRGARSAYRPETPAEIVDQVGNGFALDATDMAAGLGNARAANAVLLGALSTALPFSVDGWLEVLSQSVPARTVETNRSAFLAGREWVETADRRPTAEAAVVHAVVAPESQDTYRLEITEAWCKSCDICVKMCPERCLALNDAQIAVLAVPAACTACRLCEWLCPDFAIRVVREQEPAAVT